MRERDRLRHARQLLAPAMPCMAGLYGGICMTSLKELLRLVLTTTLSNRQIGLSLGLSHNTVNRYRHLARSQPLSWEKLASSSEDDLDRLFNRVTGRRMEKQHPDWAWVHEQMQIPGMTRTVLWEEYRRSCPERALAYSQFSHYYRRYLRTLNPTMRQHHAPGDRAFVDFSGKRPSYIDPCNGKHVPVELFVGVLGHSNRVFAMACPNQRVAHWIHAHVCMFEAFGGAPRLVVPDNLRSAVTKSGRDPVIQRTYQDMAAHYGTAILPAQSRRPRDKAKAEGGVLIVQRWVLLCLRHRTFFSLAELNQAIQEQVDAINRRPFKKMTGNRMERFEAEERAALLPLPTTPYVLGEWTASQVVPTDYHVHLDKHWYSVPFSYIGRAVEGRLATHYVEIYCAGVRIATHPRGKTDETTTDPGHMPKAHRTYAERTPEKFLEWAEQVGPATSAFVKHQFDRQHPPLGLPCCDRVKGLARKYGVAELEAAAQRAVDICSLSEKTLRAFLRHPRRPVDQAEAEDSVELPKHDNIRGGDYYAPAKGA